MAKDAKGHGSDGRGGIQSEPGSLTRRGNPKAKTDETRRAFQGKFGNTGGTMASRSGGQPVSGNACLLYTSDAADE